MAKRNVRQEVTDRIIDALEAGTVPWVKSWKGGSASGMPFNAATGRAYRGVNVLLLWAEAMDRGYATDGWMTYKQAQGKGGQVRKGERSTLVTFWKIIEVEDKDTGEEKKVFYLRHFNVFNVDQVDGLPQREEEPVVATEAERHERAEDLIAATGARISYGSARAGYHRTEDRIEMPAIEQFEDESQFYSTSFHELAHWTGAPSRLDREKGGTFGDAVYGKEELIAELSAAFTCATVGIEGKLQHAEYIGSWITNLKADNNFIFGAVSGANKATDYLLAYEGQGVEVAA